MVGGVYVVPRSQRWGEVYRRFPGARGGGRFIGGSQYLEVEEGL